MRYVVDIDGTICTSLAQSDYENAEPIMDRIAIINQLYDEGHTIIYHSARGMSSPTHPRLNALAQLTHAQLQRWGCKYHKMLLGKPSGDVYIDDKGINANDFFG